VEGLVALMENDHVGPFNLGNPGEFTMLELAEVCFYFYHLPFTSCKKRNETQRGKFRPGHSVLGLV